MDYFSQEKKIDISQDGNFKSFQQSKLYFCINRSQKKPTSNGKENKSKEKYMNK